MYHTKIRTWGGVFPIIKPYEEDSVFCDTVPGFHLAGMRVGYPTFAWDTDFCREEELFEVQFAPYHPGTATPDEAWRTVSTTDSSIEVYSVFDPDIYYQARIRARRHHLCPIHDTVMWGPWCDPILFYTGPTEPDTTTAITPVEGCPDGLFILTPNPATGTVTVTVGSLTHSSALKGTSPNLGEERLTRLGEELVLTLRDAAGHEVLRKEFSIVNCQFSIPLDLSGLAAGTYFVTLSTPASSGTQRLVVK
ncbi:MAG: T9SS type A sorting domain-containing protein [Bacteroidales bacterium]|nr:T9SS type A sorting domain-containing protein [Bacteroidales bacterium]